MEKGKQSSDALHGAPVEAGARATQLLEQMEQLLMEEKQALVVLDRDQIEALADAKLQVDECLRKAVEHCPLAAAHRPLLERVKSQALANQLLLVHARSCVQGVLSLISPRVSPGYSGGQRAPGLHASNPPPMALNLRS